MTAHTDHHAVTPRLTLPNVALMLAAALALFLAAYVVGGLFGRAADRGVAGADARLVPALEPAGEPVATLLARSVAFDARELRIPAGEPVRVRLDNEDAGILHNIAIYRDARASDLIARGALFDGPRVRDFVFEPIPAGAYYFQCDLHPTMSGTIRAE